MSATQDERTTQLLEQAVSLLGILVARSVPPDEKISQKDQIVLLAAAGLKPKQIADLLGTTPGTVSVRLAEAKKGGKSKDKKA